MSKIALFAFNGESMCFVHVLLYALDFQAKGYEARVVIEGSATGLVKTLADPDAPFARLYADVKENGLIDGVCLACSTKMGSKAEVEAQGLPLLGEMNGHPSLERYRHAGFEIVTF